MSRVLLPFPAHRDLAQRMARRLDARVGRLDWRRFPDGESLVAVDEALAGADVAIVCSLHRPDELALALRFAAETCREFGARSIGLVAPYLGYLRQDKRFHPGEAVSAPLFARFLEGSFDWLVTVDPHLHRIPTLDALFAIPAVNVAAAPAVAAWVRDHVPDAVLIGPDAESAQWVSTIARLAGLPWDVLEKSRAGDREVTVTAPTASLRGLTPVLVDDIASTGHTLLAAMARLAGLGARPPVCVVTHAVFADESCQRLLAAGAARVASTDTIAHPSNAIALDGLLADAARACFEPAADDADEADAWFDEGEPVP